MRTASIPGLNLGKALDILMNNKEIMDFLSGLKVIQTTTVGDVLDAITTALCASSSLAMRQSHRVGTSSWKSVFFTSALYVSWGRMCHGDGSHDTFLFVNCGSMGPTEQTVAVKKEYRYAFNVRGRRNAAPVTLIL